MPAGGDADMAELLAADIAPTQVDIPLGPVDLAAPFIAIPNEGESDCACLAIGKAFADNNGESFTSTKPRPGGSAQALRSQRSHRASG